ncbi:hypothetical protein D3C80_1598760 [compost metagenome]
MHQALLGQFVVFQRLIRSAEVHGLGVDLLDASAGTHRLVVDLDAGGLVVIGRPLGIQGCGEARAGAGGFLLRQGIAHAGTCHNTSHQNLNHGPLHEHTSWVEKTVMS